jgi:GrpB-like predicted nucleotidyltransferase (UPF0157 family)
MTNHAADAKDAIEVVAYDQSWPAAYAAERERLLGVAGAAFVEFEHIGSTSVAGLRAKPIIDMMVAVERLADAEALLAPLAALGYELTPTGMRNRLFLRNYAGPGGRKFHLHIVERTTWGQRKERLFRDYLRAHPEDVAAYGALKDQLAERHPHDSLAYTKDKTALIQQIVDRARAEVGLPPSDVWED